MNVENQSLSRLEKKRLRDRRAQQSKRDKRELHVKELEARVAYCERHHADDLVRHSATATLEGLRHENEMLRARLDQVRRLVTPSIIASDVYDLPDSGLNPASYGLISTSTNSPHFPGTSLEASNRVLEGLGSKDISSTSVAESRCLVEVGSAAARDALAPWSLIPMNEYGKHYSYPIATCPWLSRPDLISSCPPVPSALDLLYGSRHNYLADQINRRMRARYIRDPECLAFGWLFYIFTKWLVSPSPETFEQLPALLHPVTAQIHTGHPSALDLPMWPQLRTNLIEKWARYDFMELAGYLSCCIRVRWPWGKDFVERDEAENLRIKAEFFQTFTQESGWGLTSEFIEKYSELMEGLDVEAVRFRVDLL